jgi:hypothetical protein
MRRLRGTTAHSRRGPCVRRPDDHETKQRVNDHPVRRNTRVSHERIHVLWPVERSDWTWVKDPHLAKRIRVTTVENRIQGIDALAFSWC